MSLVRGMRVSQAGQASVEVAALIPLAVLVGFVVMQTLAAGLAAEFAGHAAESGAVALSQGGDAARAARSAVPRWSQERMHVSVDGRRVRVRLEPLAPLGALARLLGSQVDAYAGPAGP